MSLLKNKKTVLPQLNCTSIDSNKAKSIIPPLLISAKINSPKHGKKNSFTPKLENPKITKVVTQISLECEGEQAYRQHLLHTFNAMRYIKSIKQVEPSQLLSKFITLPKKKDRKKTVIFDLDETLVHCCPNPENGSMIFDALLPSGEKIQCGINIRPFVQECLKAANEFYEVIVFTASHKCYADTVLDYIDPNKELIHHRLYRDNCIITDNLYIKDLRILHNRRLEDILIVDNAAYSFAYQVDNGIPIIS